MNHPIEIIRRFIPLDGDLEQRLLKLMVERHYRRHEIINGLRTLAPYAFFIKSGSARVFYTRSGREHTTSFSFEGEFIMMPRFLLETQDDTLSIQFLEPTTVITLPHLSVKNEVSKIETVDVTEALLFVNTALLQYTMNLEEHLTIIQYSSAVERYNWAINRYPRLLETASITQLASFLGLTKETLYRIRTDNYRPTLAGSKGNQRNEHLLH